MTIERTTVHVSDDAGRIAMLEKRTIGTDDAKEVLTRYVYSNHLQSASLEMDGIGDIISYEEYHPYGTTAFQAKNPTINAVAKRYRYTGKERDEESGLYYHGARYYIPWLCRWVSVDPINNENYNLEKGYGLEKNLERDYIELSASSYEYCGNNPVNFNDLNGEFRGPTQRTTTRTRTSPVSRNVRNDVKPDPSLYDPLGGTILIPRSGGRPPGRVPVNDNNGAGYTHAAFELFATWLRPEQKKPTSAQNVKSGELMKAKYNESIKYVAPFVSMSAKKEYEKLRTITSDIRKLSEQEINEIAHRIATGQANTQDLLYAPFILNRNGGRNLAGRNNAINILSEALKMQGFSSGDAIPSNFKQKWTDSSTGIQYEVRIHPANEAYASGDIYRVSRKLPGVDAYGQGKGMEYLDIKGFWHHESTLKEYNKDGTRNSKFNSQGAKETHIQKPNIL